VEGITAGKAYVDMSTVDEATSQQIAAAVAAKGGRFLEVRLRLTVLAAEASPAAHSVAQRAAGMSMQYACMSRVGCVQIWLCTVIDYSRARGRASAVLGFSNRTDAVHSMSRRLCDATALPHHPPTYCREQHIMAAASPAPYCIWVRLQAPVSGSKKPAIDGQLIILAAGDEGLFGECEAAFNAMVSCLAVHQQLEWVVCCVLGFSCSCSVTATQSVDGCSLCSRAAVHALLAGWRVVAAEAS
jgi:hypothetical protein